MSAPKINVELLDQTLAQIEANPETWNQRAYRCRTGMCVAGWAAQLAGGKWLSEDPDGGESLIAEPADDDAFVFDFDGTKAIAAEYRAQRLLGIDREQADALFSAYNDIDDLRRIVASLKAAAEQSEGGATR